MAISPLREVNEIFSADIAEVKTAFPRFKRVRAEYMGGGDFDYGLAVRTLDDKAVFYILGNWSDNRLHPDDEIFEDEDKYEQGWCASAWKARNGKPVQLAVTNRMKRKASNALREIIKIMKQVKDDPVPVDVKPKEAPAVIVTIKKDKKGKTVDTWVESYNSIDHARDEARAYVEGMVESGVWNYVGGTPGADAKQFSLVRDSGMRLEVSYALKKPYKPLRKEINLSGEA